MFIAASRRRITKGTRISAISIALATLCLGRAFAEDAPASEGTEKPQKLRTMQIEEVIVTAQKRERAAQDVPVSMSVMTDEFHVQQGVTYLLFKSANAE